MTKTYLALAFLITGFLVAGNAYGEDQVESQVKSKHPGAKNLHLEIGSASLA